jgi:hypothetical protein
VLTDQAGEFECPAFAGPARAGETEELVDGGVEPLGFGEGLAGLGPGPWIR